MNVTPYMTMSEKPPSTKSCCCIPNRIASLITGYLTLVYTAAIVFFVTAAFVWTYQQTNGFAEFRTTESNVNNYPDVQMQKYVIAYFAAVLIFLFLINVFSLALIMICLIGIHKRRPDLMHWHVSFATARMLIVVAGVAFNILVRFDMVILLIQIFDIVFAAYCISVICSYIRQLKREAAENIKNEKDCEIFKIPIA